MGDEVEETTTSAGRCSAPGWVTWLLIVLATIVGMGATLNSWVERQALDTDQWVPVSNDMLSEDDVRAALSLFLVGELFNTVDVAKMLNPRLPEPTAPLAGPIAASLQSNAVGLVDRDLATKQFRTLWTIVNRTAHTAFVRVVRGDDGDLLVRVSERLGLPASIVDRIPADAGQLVVFESDQLSAVQQTVRVIDLMSPYLFILVVVLYGAAVFFAIDRRLALRNLGITVVVGSVLLLIAQRVTIGIGVEQLVSGRERARRRRLDRAYRHRATERTLLGLAGDGRDHRGVRTSARRGVGRLPRGVRAGDCRRRAGGLRHRAVAAQQVGGDRHHLVHHVGSRVRVRHLPRSGVGRSCCTPCSTSPWRSSSGSGSSTRERCSPRGGDRTPTPTTSNPLAAGRPRRTR